MSKRSSGFIMTGLLILLAIFAAGVIALAVWIFRLNSDIKTRFLEKRFAPPVEFYSAPEYVRIGSVFPKDFFTRLFTRRNFRKRDFGQPIQAGDFSEWTAEECRSVAQLPALAEPTPPPDPNLGPAPAAELARCIAFKNKGATSPGPRTDDPDSVHIVALDANARVLSVLTGQQPRAIEVVQIEPELFAQYYGDSPVLRDIVNLGQAPTQCLNALLAIEDSGFLDHSGVSVTGLLRAFIVNLRSGRRAQGGSTITQQLVKNYFLTEERTLKRKLTEIAMAFLVEKHASKDDILETYINLIYMGQNGPFQVRGFSAASHHYFGKPLSDLSLDQCALLAAVLNSPGLYNPFKAPDRAIKRRALVLDRMADLKMIEKEQADQAKSVPLPNRPEHSLTEPAPYFVQSVRRDLAARGLDESEGLRVYTTLNLRAQEAAHQAVRSGLDRLEKSYPHIQKLKAQGKNLEAVLLSADPATGAIEALVGGRGFLATQFNRATDSRRQVGSVMKPFVFLTAFEALQKDGQPFTPLTILKDDATTHKFEGQTWTPGNYDGTYNGDVPLFWALKESLNAATVNLGLGVGLSNIIDTARRLGITSTIKPLPSLTLGAFELSPVEVVQAYGALARMGNRVDTRLVHRIENLSKKELFVSEPVVQRVVAPEPVAELVGTMKQTLVSGTGRGARAAGFTHPAAGKTGTTNDKKDAWFAGFTPYHSAIVWVGYDDNTSHNLTGGSGAVPIWTTYMKAYASQFPPDDFKWPEGVEKVSLTPEQQMAFGVPTKNNAKLEPIELIFKRGQAPRVPPSSDATAQAQ